MKEWQKINKQAPVAAISQTYTEQEMVALETAIANKAAWLTDAGKQAAVAVQAFRSCFERSINTPEAIERLLALNVCERPETISSSMMCALICALANEKELYKEALSHVALMLSIVSTPESRLAWLENTIKQFVVDWEPLTK